MKPLSPSDPIHIGSYRLLGVLGGGGMGRVYLGQSRTGRRLAIKVVRSELADDPVFRERFAREVAAVRRVNPLYTAPVVDADTGADSPWLATTFIEGPSLERWVALEGPLGAGAVLTLAAGLAEALASIHAVGLVHRDLKPSNVLLDDGGPHIIDFGVALAPDVTRMTTSIVVGTPSYMAPERIHGNEAGSSADVFSLGATLVFAATGRGLVSDDTVFAQVMQIVSGQFDLAAVPRELRPLIVRCISPKPDDRPTAAELAQILVAAGVQAPAPGWHRRDAPEAAVAVPVFVLPRSLRPRHAALSRRQMLVGGGLVGALALGGAGLTALLLQRSDTPPAVRYPGAVLWTAKSGFKGPDRPPGGGPPRGGQPDGGSPPPSGGARPVGEPGGDRQPPAPGERIIVDPRERIIVAHDSDVQAIDRHERDVWRRPVPTNPIILYPWGGAVLVTGGAQVRVFDAASGSQLFEKDLGRPGVTTQVGRVATAGDRAYLDLGTETLAIDRTGGEVWRKARTTLRDAGQMDANGPQVANSSYVVTQEATGTQIRVTLRDAVSGAERWTTPLTRTQAAQPPPGERNDAWMRCEARLGVEYVLLRHLSALIVLRLADGSVAWNDAGDKPVASIELLDDLVLVGADQLYARQLADGAQRWTQPAIRGARLSTYDGGRSAVAADEPGWIAGLSPQGSIQWRERLPEAVRNGRPDRVVVDGDTAYITFSPRDPGGELLDADVAAIALKG